MNVLNYKDQLELTSKYFPEKWEAVIALYDLPFTTAMMNPDSPDCVIAKMIINNEEVFFLDGTGNDPSVCLAKVIEDMLAAGFTIEWNEKTVNKYFK